MADNIREPYITGMTGACQALTAKEKAALRLLLEGYDAKSMARHLGLSVHTVNERLRDARRKLGTSSSREAARMLREEEGATPEFLADKAFGDAAVPLEAQQDLQPAQGHRNPLRTGWIFGGIAMSATIVLAALWAMSGPGQAPAASLSSAAAVSPTPASEAAAIEAAQKFLALVDRDDWAGSWRETHRSFQLLNTVEWWAEASRKIRAELGAPQTRELATVNFTAAPPNGYWEITFRASYSRKGKVTETLSLASESGEWKVAGIAVE